MATKTELDNAIEEIFSVQEQCEGSRVAMQDALDEIRELCLGVNPDLETDEEADDADGDGIPDDEQGD